ncbi:MAG: hypothetical protein LRY76_03885 [Alphaproteobacteria bacterium]|nr:hypothetical protein [Alphaproteobacteria bacterium]
MSTTSRIVGALSQYRQSGQPYNLVKLHIAPDERRRKEIYLTTGGREIIDKASAVFLPSEEDHRVRKITA